MKSLKQNNSFNQKMLKEARADSSPQVHLLSPLVVKCSQAVIQNIVNL